MIEIDESLLVRLAGLTKPTAVGIIDLEHTRRRLRELQTHLGQRIVSDD